MRPGNTKTVYDLDKISIHAPREGCDVFVPDAEGFSAISIHAPREGCDSAAPPIPLVIIPISIHAPREGCDDCGEHRYVIRERFQSTHPVRGATM